jgi:hypothetical protein
MTYSAADLSPVNGIAHIRAHPEMYLPSGRVDGHSLASAIVADVLVEPGRGAAIQRVDRWWLVASDHDWVGPSVIDYFHRVVPFPDAGPNSMRAEVLLTAFADDVVTFDAASHEVIKGMVDLAEPIFALRKRHPEWKRVIAFRLAD